MKKILFITPTLARTGSEMILWHLLNNIDRTKFEPYVYVFKQGELFDQLPKNITKYLNYKEDKRFHIKLLRLVLKVFKINQISFQLLRIQRTIKADLWYVNTCTLSQPFMPAKEIGVKVVTHVHENLFGFTLLGNRNLKEVITCSDYLIACSNVVYENLEKIKDSKKLLLQNCFIDTNQIKVDLQLSAKLRKELSIPSDRFVWIISGSVHYIKGIEYLIQLLEIFKDENVCFVWLGKETDDGLNYYLNQIALRSNNKLIMCGAKDEDYYHYLKMGNGLLMLSKAESFSLVILEAAYCELPIVSFDVGMAKELIKKDMGIVIDGYDLGKLQEAMAFYHQGGAYNPDALRDAVKPYTLAVQVPKFERLLTNLLQ